MSFNDKLAKFAAKFLPANTGKLLTIDSTGEGALIDSSFNFRNRVINGSMRIDQRRSGSSVLANSGDFIADRFPFITSQNGKYTVQTLLNDTTFSSYGFNSNIKVTVTTSYTTVSTDYASIDQKIEGLNVPDIMWGTANARPVTISFLVKSSIAGTYTVSLVNGSGTRFYSVPYTITSANTVQQVSVTIPGDVTGSWAMDNTTGLWLRFNIGSGSNYQGTLSSWGSSPAYQPSGGAVLSGTVNATFQLTGVQLEVGSIATPFERRPYGLELFLCQRYYEISSPFKVWGYLTAGAVIGHGINFSAVKRGTPTVALINQALSGISAINTEQIGVSGITFYGTSTSGGSVSFSFNYTADAEL
jgi:hypothetical protein